MKVVTFGEVMLRLSPENNKRLVQANNFQASYGGAEANVAVSLSHFGVISSFITKLPNNEMGQAAINALRSYGVNTSQIVRGGNRIGIYYLEKGASQRPSKVIYDREYSSIAMSTKNDYDWETILNNIDFFYFTGITPALGDNVIEILEEALIIARKKRIKVVCDLNYRKNLWSKEKAQAVMSKLMAYVDICILNEEDANTVFNIPINKSNVEKGTLNHGEYKGVINQLLKMFNFEMVAITLRNSISANINHWSAILSDGENQYFSKDYKIQIVDRVGSGDSFGAGLLYGLISKLSNQETLDFATATSCLKHSIEGDFNLITVEEVMRLVHGDESGRVQR